MKPLQLILANAAKSDRKIVLSEGEDPRVIAAAIAARQQSVARIVLVGDRTVVRKWLVLAGGQDIDGIEVHDPRDSRHFDEMAAFYYKRRAHKGVTPEAASVAVLNAHVYAAALVKLRYADGTLGGATTATADIVRSAIQVIGMAPDAKMVSSFFLMLLCKDHHEKKGAFIFSDAGLVIDPNASEMAEIGHASAVSLSKLTGDIPRVAMLSFSTRASAAGEKVSKVVEATAILRNMAPDLIVDGELQFDAAFMPDVAETKAPGSALGGNANVFVFPSLNAGNIAYKIAQRIGGAVAIGPILQGLALPANDLSRGCNAEDILHMIAVTAAQCEG